MWSTTYSFRGNRRVAGIGWGYQVHQNLSNYAIFARKLDFPGPISDTLNGILRSVGLVERKGGGQKATDGGVAFKSLVRRAALKLTLRKCEFGAVVRKATDTRGS